MWSFIKLVVWGIMWLPTWLCISTYRYIKKKPRLDNCLSWSLRQWEQRGGYLVIRWCRSSKVSWIKWPHFLWLDEQDHNDLRHFIPLKQNQGTRYFPDPWFEGKVQKGDPKDQLEN